MTWFKASTGEDSINDDVINESALKNPMFGLWE